MLPWIILFFLRWHHILRSLPCVIALLLIYSNSITRKNVLFLSIVFCDAGFTVELGRFHIVERRSKVNIDIGINDANCVVFILWPNFKDVDFVLFSKNFDSYRVFLVQTCEITQLKLQNCLWVVEVNELGLMRLQLDHVANVAVLLFKVRNKRYCCWTSWLRELQHFKHPTRNIA